MIYKKKSIQAQLVGVSVVPLFFLAHSAKANEYDHCYQFGYAAGYVQEVGNCDLTVTIRAKHEGFYSNSAYVPDVTVSPRLIRLKITQNGKPFNGYEDESYTFPKNGAFKELSVTLPRPHVWHLHPWSKRTYTSHSHLVLGSWNSSNPNLSTYWGYGQGLGYF